MALKYYTTRYMNINKCAEIKRDTTCTLCGWELDGQHETDFDEGVVIQKNCCPKCQKEPIVQEFALQ